MNWLQVPLVIIIIQCLYEFVLSSKNKRSMKQYFDNSRLAVKMFVEKKYKTRDAKFIVQNVGA